MKRSGPVRTKTIPLRSPFAWVPHGFRYIGVAVVGFWTGPAPSIRGHGRGLIGSSCWPSATPTQASRQPCWPTTSCPARRDNRRPQSGQGAQGLGCHAAGRLIHGPHHSPAQPTAPVVRPLRSQARGAGCLSPVAPPTPGAVSVPRYSQLAPRSTALKGF